MKADRVSGWLAIVRQRLAQARRRELVGLERPVGLVTEPEPALLHMIQPLESSVGENKAGASWPTT